MLSGGAWALVSRLVAAVAGFAANLLVVRLLPPTDVGFYFLLVSVVALGTTIGQAGLQVAVVRLAAEAGAAGDDSGKHGVIAGSVKLVAMISAAVGIVVAAFGPTVLQWLSIAAASAMAFALAGGWILSLSLISVIAESQRGLHQYRVASFLGSTLPNLATVAALGALLGFAAHPSLEMVIAAVVGAVTVVGIYCVGMLVARLGSVKNMVHGSSRELLSTGLPLLVTMLAVFAMTQLDLWIVGSHRGVAEAASYGAAARLVALVMMPMLIGNMALQPLVAELNGRGEMQGIERLVRATGAATGLAALVVLAFLCLAAEPILGLVYGDYYRGGASVLVLLAAGQTMNALTGPGAVVLMMTGGQREVMVISLFCGVAMAVAGVLVVSSHGGVGVAAVTALTAGVHGLACLLMVNRRHGIWVHASVGGLARAIRQARMVAA